MGRVAKHTLKNRADSVAQNLDFVRGNAEFALEHSLLPIRDANDAVPQRGDRRVAESGHRRLIMSMLCPENERAALVKTSQVLDNVTWAIENDDNGIGRYQSVGRNVVERYATDAVHIARFCQTGS